MAKAKTSEPQRGSMKNSHKIKHSDLREYSPTRNILNINKVGAGIMECLLKNDPEGAMEIIKIYLETVNRVQMAKKSHIPRSTLYHSLKNKNPTIKTLAKIVHGTVINKVA